jgi:hypothetical protein
MRAVPSLNIIITSIKSVPHVLLCRTKLSCLDLAPVAKNFGRKHNSSIEESAERRPIALGELKQSEPKQRFEARPWAPLQIQIREPDSTAAPSSLQSQ